MRITTNSIESAHLLYLISRINDRAKSDKINEIIDSMTGNLVLLLGNFSTRNKYVLKSLRQQLQKWGYAAMIFDFPHPKDRDLIETVAILAGLSRFVIADLTEAKSTPLESLLVISGFKIPFAPIIREKNQAFSMFDSLQAKYDWVLKPFPYQDSTHLISKLKKYIVDPCEAMRKKIIVRRKNIENESKKMTKKLAKRKGK